MNFKTPADVRKVIHAGDEAAHDRSENRKRVSKVFNGDPLVDPEQAKKMGLHININFGTGPVLAQHGRRQFHSAFLTRKNFFKVSLPDAPAEKQADWSNFITRKINRVLKSSHEYYELHRNRWSVLLLHGIGPQIWDNAEDWLPRFASLANLRFPTSSETSFRKMPWFAELMPYTEFELASKVFGEHADDNWNKEAVKKILNEYHDKNIDEGTSNISWSNQPEEMYTLTKENNGIWSADAAPTIKLWHFYYLDDSNPKKSQWKLCVIPDDTVKGLDDKEIFLYRSKDAFAKKLSHILHCQFGDLNPDAPFKIHAIRAFGFLLMEPIFWENMTMCRGLQHLWENMNIWLQATDPTGRAKARSLELFDKCFIPEGISIITKDKRHQIDEPLFAGILDRLKRLQQEASVSYAPNSEVTGRQVDETATAVMARVSQVNAMMSGLLATAAEQEKFSYIEICRRFCIADSENDDVKQFRRDCLEYGIPSVYLDVRYWDVDPDMPIGDGNPTMEMAKTDKLIAMRPMFGPEAQQEILHEATVAVAGAEKAARWAGVDQKSGITNAEQQAELLFATLMFGVEAQGNPALSPMQQIEVMLGLMSGVIARIEGTGNMATAGEIAGLNTVGKYIAGLIAQFAQDKAQTERARQYSDVLGNLENTIKGFSQRLSEQQQAANQHESISLNYKDAPDSIKRQMEAAAGFQPATNGDVDPKVRSAAVKLAVVEEKSAQKQRHDEADFQAEQRRKYMDTIAEIERKNALLQVEIDRLKATPTPDVTEP